MPAVSSRGRGRRTMSEPNMVPFIDVMLVLLIIFMVTAPLITPSMVDLPSVGVANKQPPIRVEVIIGDNESLEVRFNGSSKQVTLATLVEAVKKAQISTVADGTPVVISSSKGKKYDQVMEVYQTLTLARIPRVGLAVEVKN
jgi:biopolymer transport protein TolR